MTSSRTNHDTTERWLSRELRERIAQIGTALMRQADNGRDQADPEPQLDREAER